MDEDLNSLSREELVAEVKKLRLGIRDHRDSTKHDLCWHHPQLWSLLPEKVDHDLAVPEWPQFLRGCVRYRESLDRELPDAPRVADEYETDGMRRSRRTNLSQIAERFLFAWNSGSLHIVDELAAQEIVVSYPHFPEPIRGAEAFKQALSATYSSFPDIRIEADEVLTVEDRVVIFWTYRGTHEAGELFGHPPSGRQVTVPGVSRYRIRDGKVAEERGIVDNHSLMTQLAAG